MDSLPYPDGCRGAVSLTFDDAHPSQLSVAVPTMERYGLRGTFYVNPREDYRQQLKPFAELVARGHELGNHTVSHPCSRNFDFVTRGLEEWSLEEIEADILEAARRLQELAPEVQEWTFCYPCYQSDVGEGERRQSYTPIVARHFLAARAWGEAANHPGRVDLHYLGSYDCHRRSGAEMIGLCELAAAEGRWVILTFHGVGSGHLSVDARDFEKLCAHLGAHRDRLWTAPVVQVARAVRRWREQQRG
ncbi:MAG: hypothetical protein KatS3mg115_2188 [Candidatus Poribacteria bacterium]|nr:MAG: hypothetical protein KatS3mg115_2188 [Candidatus Poribacteria bacterium]